MRKVVIIGVDALEYDLVEKWNLKNLKQVEYGKTILPISEEDCYYYVEPSTYIMWTSFVTGKPPRENGVKLFTKYRFPLDVLIETVFFKWFKIGKKPRPAHYDRKKFYGIVEVFDKINYGIRKMGFARPPRREDINSDTIFDVVKPSVALHIPVFSNEDFPPYEKKIVKAIEDKMYKPIFRLACMEDFELKVKETYDWIRKNSSWKLFMQYFYVLDAIQHVFYNRMDVIFEFYKLFDKFVSSLSSRLNELDDDVLLLIVSDHGQHRGIHTNHGFYSVNKPLGLKNPRLIDFRWIIQDYLGGL